MTKNTESAGSETKASKSSRYRVRELADGRWAVYDTRLQRYATGVFHDRADATARARKLQD